MADRSDEHAQVEAYLAALPDGKRAALERLRSALKAAAPGAVDAISYSMPALRLNGRILVYYAAFKDHLSLFPASGKVMEQLGDELRDHYNGRGTLHFTPDAPLPDELIQRIVGLRSAELAAGKRS